MEILLKLTIPNNTIKEIDEVSDKLWPEYCWWDVVSRIIENSFKIVGGEMRFVKIIKKKRRWFRRV